MATMFKVVKMLFCQGSTEVDLEIKRIGQRVCAMVEDKVGRQDWQGEYVVRMVKHGVTRRYGIVVCFEGVLEADKRWHVLTLSELEEVYSSLMEGLFLLSLSFDDKELVVEDTEGASMIQGTMGSVKSQGFDVVWGRSVRRMSKDGEWTLVVHERAV